MPQIVENLVRVRVRVDVTGGNLSSTTIDDNAFAEFVFRDTVPRSTKIKNLDNWISTELYSKVGKDTHLDIGQTVALHGSDASSIIELDLPYAA